MTDDKGKKPKKAPKASELAGMVEVAVEVEPKTSRATAIVPRKPVPQDIKLSARQFIRARQFRWERSAGFLIDMKRKHGPDARLTRPEWDTHWAAFWARPVR